ncbi:MAG: NAD(P)H-hydrate epimerase [Chloroflexi bacterium]|nr:NAD(P)H-hydrate epimerase [Chloroflexota bacterium]
MNIPALTTAQMAEVDRLMIEEYGITLPQMMENAGRNLAELTRRLLGGSAVGRTVAVLCGGGNNGGGGMTAARHLHNRGVDVHLIRVGGGNLKDVPSRQWRILETMGLRDEPDFDLSRAEVILDAMIGYGLTGDPRPNVAVWIEKVNTAPGLVLALDAPSGLDTTSGAPGRPCVQADATLTLALPKTGLLTPSAYPFVGDLYLADISVPPELYQRLGLNVGPLFSQDTIIRIEHEQGEHHV